MAELVIAKSKIKEQVPDCNMSADFADGAHEVVLALVQQAVVRAKSQNRKTVQAKDVYARYDPKKEQTIVLVTSKIKDYVKQLEEGFAVSADFIPALNALFLDNLQEYQARTLAYNKKTLAPSVI